jgi:hypothetical protein
MLCSCTNILHCVIERRKLLDGDVRVSNAIPSGKHKSEPICRVVYHVFDGV